MPKWISINILLLIIPTIFILFTALFQKRLIFFPDQRYYRMPDSIRLEYQTVRFQTSDQFLYRQRIFETYQGSKEFLEIQGGHNDGFSRSQTNYSKKIQTFITEDW